jgi:excinuclease ABC subunit C
VYLFKDDRGRVLYIGKAKSLRDRVQTYFTPAYPRGDPRLAAMISRIADIEVMDAESEIEALMLESKLIKQIRPRYNVKERDDKSFGCLVLTADDDFPKVRFARETDKVEGERFGPFPNAGDLRRAIRVLQGIFRFATCSLDIREGDPKRKFFRPCLLYSIRRCTAPCGARVTKADYAADIESLRRFLRGDKKGLVRDLERKMRRAAGSLQFERAAELRDQIRALESLSKEFSLDDVREMDVEPIDPGEALRALREMLGLDSLPRTLEACDIATIQGADSVGSIVTFVDGIPFKDGYRRFRIKRVRGVDDFEMMREVVGRRFARLKSEGEIFPDLFLVDGGPGQLSAASGVLRKLGVRTVLLALAKKEETLYREGRRTPVAAPKDSLGLRLLMHARDEAHRFAQRYHHLLRRKGMRT